jgi:putative glutamine amidotransferase
MSSSRPLVGVVADRRRIGHHEFHAVGEKYLHALVRFSNVETIILPTREVSASYASVFAQLDGLFLTGSPSNVEPHHYRGTPSEPGTLHDSGRDSAVFDLLPKAIECGLPLLTVCRGFQELNVSMGGTLHQKVHEVDGYFDHRENPTDAVEDQYAPAHPVHVSPEGHLFGITGKALFEVNSLHSQGIDRLADGLSVEAVSPDGLIEAVWVKAHPSFALGVQWHPEWQAERNPESVCIFKAFGAAVAEHRNLRLRSLR